MNRVYESIYKYVLLDSVNWLKILKSRPFWNGNKFGIDNEHQDFGTCTMLQYLMIFSYKEYFEI